MDDVTPNDQEQSVQRWGGLAGVAGSVIFVIVFAVVIGLVGEPDEPAEFADVRGYRVVEDGLYLAVLVFWLPHVVAWYRVLRSVRLAPALFGAVLSAAGLVILAAGALPHVMTQAAFDLYDAPGATAADQATLELIWAVAFGVFDALLIVGLILAAAGMASLGVAMLGHRGVGNATAWLGVALGTIGAVGAAFLLIDPASAVAVLAVFGLIIFHAVAGVKLYRLAGAGALETPHTAGL